MHQLCSGEMFSRREQAGKVIAARPLAFCTVLELRSLQGSSSAQVLSLHCRSGFCRALGHVHVCFGREGPQQGGLFIYLFHI